MTTLAGSGVDSLWGYGTDWLYILVPLLVALSIGALAVRHGEAPTGAQRGTRTVLRFADGMGKATGTAPFAAAGVMVMVPFLLIAALGFYWDVSWHVDYGRDEIIFTPGHTAIIVGLQGLLLAAAVTTLVATWTRADVALVGKRLRAPWAAVVLAALGIGAVGAFPLDEIWHRAYGVDVTMWGPTHLAMIGGASFGPLALLLLLREGGGRLTHMGRHLVGILTGATLLGMTTFQLEYDLGVSQWQQLYHPILVALASGFALVMARHLLGRGGALYGALNFTIHRLLTALVVGTALNHTTPHWALYWGSALFVEIAYELTRKRAVVVQALASGVAVTLGLSTEWAWTQVWGRHPWDTALFPGILVAAVAAVAAAFLGTAAGRTLRGTKPGLPAPLLWVAFLAVVGTLVFPFARNHSTTTAVVRTTPAGEGMTHVSITLDDPSVAENPNWFETFAWQGGGLVRSTMVRVGDTAEWRTEDPVPYGGSWKTMVRLANDDVLVAAPVAFPRDEEIGAEEIPYVAERTVALRRDTSLLQREARAGTSAVPATVAYSVLGVFAALWISSIALAFRNKRLRRPDPVDGARVVVTGALGGIGVAITEGLRAQGATVVGIDLVEAPDVIAADVTDASSTKAAVEEAAARLGGIDVVVNLAGIGRAQDAGDLPDAEARRVLDVNFWGTWHATAAALPWLVRSGGHAVVTASGLAVANVPWAAAYAASKRAVAAYADTLRLEYGDRITVTVVNPGYIRTPIHEVPAAAGASLEGLIPADDMSDVVDAYVRACAERPRSISTSWRTTLSLGFARRWPAAADRVVRRGMARLDRPDPSFTLTDEELARRASARESVVR
ncbi:MAG TPA: SDR family NAD(P)-dependent oxidoreductase [Frankiaceae bacterium]|nr:SDR family NAD(P)-dependent oxidoreductase [Frankiaceae bacterium]